MQMTAQEDSRSTKNFEGTSIIDSRNFMRGGPAAARPNSVVSRHSLFKTRFQAVRRFTFLRRSNDGGKLVGRLLHAIAPMGK